MLRIVPAQSVEHRSSPEVSSSLPWVHGTAATPLEHLPPCRLRWLASHSGEQSAGSLDHASALASVDAEARADSHVTWEVHECKVCFQT